MSDLVRPVVSDIEKEWIDCLNEFGEEGSFDDYGWLLYKAEPDRFQDGLLEYLDAKDHEGMEVSDGK